MERVNRCAHPNVSTEEPMRAADKVSLDARPANRILGDGNSAWSFPGSPTMRNTACSEELPRPTHRPNKAGYPEYGSHPEVLNNLITLTLNHGRLENTAERWPG